LSLIPRLMEVAKFPPRIRSGAAHCQEIVLEGDRIDLRDIPIILCSAAADIPVQPNPSIEYARKPIAFDALLAMLKRMSV